MKTGIGLAVTAAIWLAMVNGMWAVQHDAATRGVEIKLKVQPVDPRDLFRGDYVTLGYDLNNVTVTRPEDGEAVFHKGEIVYLKLARRDGVWQPAGLINRKPDTGMYLRGRVQRAAPENYRIEYGIESFFVPEGTGKPYEDAVRRDRLWAVINVGAGGTAKLKRLEVRENAETIPVQV